MVRPTGRFDVTAPIAKPSLGNLQIGFIGAGRMATALGQGLVTAGLVEGSQLAASDPISAATAAFAGQTGGRIAASNLELAQASDLIVLAVKPQQLGPVLKELAGHLTAEALIVSIVAGATLKQLADGLGLSAKSGSSAPVRLVRVMPNTPCLVGHGASAFALGPQATDADGALVGTILGAVGSAYQVDEKLLDAVTGLSGSGPAFVYMMIEALSDGGVNMGLPRGLATSLAAQTVAGAAHMVLQTGEHPGALKDAVASPGGTTIRGLQALEDRGLRAALMAAVEAATRRAEELGQK